MAKHFDRENLAASAQPFTGRVLLLLIAALTLLIAGEFGPRLAAAAEVAPVVCNDTQSASSAAPELASSQSWTGFFTNYGTYMPRLHCMHTAEGRPDWPWITALLAFTALVMIGYLRIFVFWLTAYFQEAREDRNRPLLDLAVIFLSCAICGYATSMLFFVWPAYRLLVLLLIVLAAFTWRFVFRLDRFRISLQAKRLQRELQESLEQRNEELKSMIAERTRELDDARCAADAANEAKSAFLANMSHEIRTPMTAILGYADILSEALESDDADEPGRRAVETIRRNGNHLLCVINDVLDLSRIEAGRLDLERIECAPEEVIADVVSLLANRAEAKGIDLRVRYLTPVPRRLMTDPVRLRQVLLNVAGNAIKFTDCGEVRLDVHFEAEAPCTLVISVVDTGIGMPQSALHHIFDPFQQADASTIRRFGGTGLGLTISRKLMRGLGGDITVESEHGAGSTFDIRLPVDEAFAHDLVTEPSATPRSSPVQARDPKVRLTGRILIAEDGPDNQRLLTHHLLRAGAKDVVIVENGKLAIDEIERACASGRPFALLVLDMQMPVMDGYTAASHLRAQHRELPILALTAHAMTGDRERCLAAGCSDYATKPIDPALLIAKCSALMAGQPVQCANDRQT